MLKRMVRLQDFPHNSALFGLVQKYPLVGQPINRHNLSNMFGEVEDLNSKIFENNSSSFVLWNWPFDRFLWQSCLGIPKEDLLRWHKDRVGELWFACWKDRTWCQKISQKRSFDGARSCTLQFFLNRKSSFRLVGEIPIENKEEIHGYSSCWRRFFGTTEAPKIKCFRASHGSWWNSK